MCIRDRVFDGQDERIRAVCALPEVAVSTETLEENAMVQYKDRQTMAVLDVYKRQLLATTGDSASGSFVALLLSVKAKIANKEQVHKLKIILLFFILICS